MEPVTLYKMSIGGNEENKESQAASTLQDLEDLWYKIKHPFWTEWPQGELQPCQEMVALLAKREKEWKVTLPADLKTILAWPWATHRINKCTPVDCEIYHPDNWLHKELAGTHVVRFMYAPLNNYYWYFSWKTGSSACTVWVSKSKDFKDLKQTSGSLVNFFADMTKQGNKWYAENLYMCDKIVTVMGRTVRYVEWKTKS